MALRSTLSMDSMPVRPLGPGHLVDRAGNSAGFLALLSSRNQIRKRGTAGIFAIIWLGRGSAVASSIDKPRQNWGQLEEVFACIPD